MFLCAQKMLHVESIPLVYIELLATRTASVSNSNRKMTIVAPKLPPIAPRTSRRTRHIDEKYLKTFN